MTGRSGEGGGQERISFPPGTLSSGTEATKVERRTTHWNLFTRRGQTRSQERFRGGNNDYRMVEDLVLGKLLHKDKSDERQRRPLGCVRTLVS